MDEKKELIKDKECASCKHIFDCKGKPRETKGVIGKKLPSDTTLNNMRKADLIKLLHLAESNHRVLAETYKIAIDTSKCNHCPLSIDTRRAEQIRADAIEECIYWLETHCMANNYKGIPTEDIRGVLEELKERSEWQRITN